MAQQLHKQKRDLSGLPGSTTNLGKLGLGADSSEKEKELALRWAALASYLPNRMFSYFSLFFSIFYLFFLFFF